MKLSYLILMLVAVSLGFAVDPGEVNVIQPISTVISQGGSIDAGFIGPGQTLSVMVSSKVDTGGKYGQGGNWDNLRADELPSGWAASFSEYGQNLKINIKAPADAPEGRYHLLLSVNDVDDREMIGGQVQFYVEVEIRNDVIEMYVFPETMTVATGSPARYSVKLFNPSTASDAFVVEGVGVQGWGFRKEVFVPAKGSTTIYYEIVNTDEEVIPLLIRATSKSSDRVHAEHPIMLTTKSDPYYDVLSIRNGLLLYPPLEFLIYAPLYLVSSLL